ncbi:RHS repeat-associated core domain-containing protein [Marinobacteraceae bacterium S3BR75-40.1]
MSRTIEILADDGSLFRIGPPDQQAASDGVVDLNAVENAHQWLRSRFSFRYGEDRGLWEGLMEAHGDTWLAASDKDQLFRKVATLVRKGELQLYQLPQPKLPPKDNDGGSEPPPVKAEDIPTKEHGPASVASATPASSQPQSPNSSDPGPSSADMQCQGDPVAPVTGEEILDIEDFHIDGPMPLRWVRRYRSGYCDRQLGMGAGWALPALRRVGLEDGRLWVLDDEARPLPLGTLKRGEVTWQLHTGLRVEWRKDNRIIVTEADGRAWIMATQDGCNWWPTRLLNQTGQGWRFLYDAAFRLARIQISADTSVVLRYSAAKEDQVSVLREVHLEQGDHRRLLAQYRYDAQGDLVQADSDHGCERYRYDGHLLVERELPTGYRFHFEWQGQGPRARCLRSQGEQGHHDFRFHYQPERYLTKVEDAHGHTRVYHYDGNGRIVARQEPDGALWQWAYDGLGRLVKETRPDGATSRHNYNRFGRKEQTTGPDGRSHRWFYNDLGFCTAEQLQDGRWIKRRLDPVGRLVEEQRADGSCWQYHYEGDHGWPSRMTSDSGETVELGWGEDGKVLARDQNGYLERFAYTAEGQIAGRLDQGLVTEQTYQGTRLEAVHQYPEKAPDQKRSRQYRYDAAGRLTEWTNAEGERHRYEYGQLLRPQTYCHPDGKKVHYRYDLSERLTAVTRPDGAQWQLEWDALGQVSRCSAPDGRDIQFHYDRAGHIVRREQPGLWVQTLTRDPAGRVLSQTSQGRDRQAVSRHFQYDALGRRTHASCADRKLHWRYNDRGQVTEESQDQHRIAYGYGPGSRLEQLRLPDGTIVDYGYDANGRWQTLSVNGKALIERTLDNQGRESQRRAGENQQSQLHDRYGCLIKRRWQGQKRVTRRYDWDQEARLESVHDSDAGDTHYHRDLKGQLIGENDTTYHYDAAGHRLPEGGRIEQDRLVATAKDQREYDRLGAEIRVTGGTMEQRRFDAEGQLIEVQNASSHVTYGYDALGRRAWRKCEAGTTTYLWHNDVLLGEQNPEGQWQWYIRDPESDEPLLTLVDEKPYHYELDWRSMPIRLWSEDGRLAWQANADAWGQCQPEGDVHQPIRLPGQFEDELTGLYHNRFRDYDPQTGRYLTPDPLGLKGGLTPYRYTPNPVDYIDPLGLSGCDKDKKVDPFSADDTEMAAVGDDVPSAQEISLADVRRMSKGDRPKDPSTYLSEGFIASHLNRFSGGASFLMPKWALDEFGREFVGRPDGQFVMPSSEVDQVLRNSDGEMAKVEEELGIPEGQWQDTDFVRIDVPSPEKHGLRMPTGNEEGANDEWLPGGQLPTGHSEAVIDPVPKGSYEEHDFSDAVKRANKNASD